MLLRCIFITEVLILPLVRMLATDGQHPSPGISICGMKCPHTGLLCNDGESNDYLHPVVGWHVGIQRLSVFYSIKITLNVLSSSRSSQRINYDSNSPPVQCLLVYSWDYLPVNFLLSNFREENIFFRELNLLQILNTLKCLYLLDNLPWNMFYIETFTFSKFLKFYKQVFKKSRIFMGYFNEQLLESLLSWWHWQILGME